MKDGERVQTPNVRADLSIFVLDVGMCFRYDTNEDTMLYIVLLEKKSAHLLCT